MPSRIKTADLGLWSVSFKGVVGVVVGIHKNKPTALITGNISS